ncbi:MAG: nucleotidyltransferase domain-containing protein [Oscillospiraceae bacterium]|nr:nucleotidyltransferase domain-containing protein [Oscillospiraceae bacterium]
MKSRSEINEIAQKVLQAARLCLGEKLDRVILYGSYARGDSDDDSDIDIIILAKIKPEEAWKIRMEISRNLAEFDLEYDILVSLQVADCKTFYEFADEVPYYKNVLKHGVDLSA